MSTPLNHVAYALEIPLLGLALATVIFRVYSRFAVNGRLAADDVLILLGTVCGPSSKATKVGADDYVQGCAVARTVVSCISADDLLGYDRRG